MRASTHTYSHTCVGVKQLGQFVLYMYAVGIMTAYIQTAGYLSRWFNQ